ncbi:glutamate receptor ionotropic, kainate 2-like [Liolophura sinensis]|uniref:glutamate receptor ionotropic, kainate 2-like n=1 Tax=Liolophura sinensis TaxID=3198878 RepID=UPI003158D0A8
MTSVGVNSISHNGVRKSKGRTLSVLPDLSTLSNAIAEFAHGLNWRDVVLLSEEDFSPVLSLSAYNIQVLPMRLPSRIESPTDEELRQILIPLRESQRSKIILHSMKKDVIDSVIRAAKNLHLLYHSLDWLVTYPDFADIVSGRSTLLPGRLFGLQLVRPSAVPKTLIGNFSSSMTRLDLAVAFDAVGISRNAMSTHAACDKSDHDRTFTAQMLKGVLHKYEKPYEGALGTYFWEDKYPHRRTNYTLDILLYKGNATKIAEVYFEDGEHNLTILQMPTDDPKEDAVFGNQDIVHIVTRLEDPFVMCRDGKYVGFSVDLLNAIAKNLQFVYELYEVADNSYGERTNGQWNGMVKQLQSGNASLAIGAFAVTSEREEVISFSYAILSTMTSLLLKKSEPQWNFFQFLWPFSVGLWLMIVAFFFVVGITMFLMSKYDQTQRASVQRFDLKESMWYSLNVLLQGGTEYSPQTTCTRTIVAFYWFCILVINAAYTANLAAFLTLRQIDNRLKDVGGLARQTTVKYGVLKSSDVMTFFNRTREDPYERMWTFMKLNEDEVILSNSSQVIEKVAAGNYIFLADGIVNEYYAVTHCGIESIEQNFGGKQFGIGLPKGAPYRDSINKAILELKENGLLDNLRKKWWKPRQDCEDDGEDTEKDIKGTAELSITNMFGVFIVLGTSVVLAICAELGKRIFKHSRKKKKQKEGDLGISNKASSEQAVPII